MDDVAAYISCDGGTIVGVDFETRTPRELIVAAKPSWGAPIAIDGSRLYCAYASSIWVVTLPAGPIAPLLGAATPITALTVHAGEVFFGTVGGVFRVHNGVPEKIAEARAPRTMRIGPSHMLFTSAGDTPGERLFSQPRRSAMSLISDPCAMPNKSPSQPTACTQDRARGASAPSFAKSSSTGLARRSSPTTTLSSPSAARASVAGMTVTTGSPSASATMAFSWH